MKKHDVTLYALSTCMHCRRAKDFLENECVPYQCIYVDQLEGDERRSVLDLVRKYNPRLSFPTILIDGDNVLVGFEQEALEDALK